MPKKRRRKKQLQLLFASVLAPSSAASCSSLINCVCWKDKGTCFLEIVVIDARLSTKALLILCDKKKGINIDAPYNP